MDSILTIPLNWDAKLSLPELDAVLAVQLNQQFGTYCC
jgi:hypothetical protein